MFSKKALKLIVIFNLLIMALFMLRLDSVQGGQDEPDPAPQEVVAQAWEKAQQSSTYTFQTEHFQTTYPAPGIGSAGQQPEEDHVALTGSLDQAAETMNLTFWQDASFNPDTGVEIKVEDGVTYGRRGQGSWEEIEDITGAFAPNGDPLSFLAGATDIEAAGEEVRSYPDSNVEMAFSRYTFTFDGPAFAEYVRDQAELDLQKRGELPPNVHLDLPEIYLRTTGTGQLWLDSDGLPSRLSLDLDLGRQDNGEEIEAVVVTDYSGYDLERIEQLAVTVNQNPALWLANRLAPLADIRVQSQIGLTLSFVLMATAVFLFAVKYWQRREFYTVVVTFSLFTMLVTPILQAEQIHAFGQRQYERQAAGEARQSEAEEEKVNSAETNWNPHLAPAQQYSEQVQEEAAAMTLDLPVKDSRTNRPANTTHQQSGDVDSDGDGLSDEDEARWGSDINDTDTDDDGLSDGVEVNELFTTPTLADSDNDAISDKLEIEGFTFGGQDWYLNPNEPDSNGDGILDGVECFVWASGNPDQNTSEVCPDTDGDDLPDVYDDDNDNDGVKDDIDSSPNDVSAVFDRYNPLELNIANLAIDEPVIVNLQLRPTDIATLAYHNHVLDWPSGDTQGFIQRRLDTTFANTDSDYRSDDANAAYGDVRVLPMVEVTIPYSEGHYGNLPVLDSAPIARTQTMTVGQWLDTTELDQYGIMVVDKGDESGDLLMYAPVIPFSSAGADMPTGFGANIFYWPGQGSGGVVDWGSSHEYRLVWMVQMLTDECSTGRLHCPTYMREDTMTIIHNYYEDWQATGLRISEELGTDAAIIYENPAQDSDLRIDDALWPISWNLSTSFVTGRDCDAWVNESCQGNGSADVTLDNLESSITGWLPSGQNYVVVEQMPDYPHRNYLAQVASSEARDLLDSVFYSYRNQTIPTLLFAYETTNRSVSLNQVSFNGNVATADFDGQEAFTTSGINWGSYQYKGGSTPWESYALDQYLVYLSAQLEGYRSDFQAANDTAEAAQEADGKLLWAQLYYATVYTGLSNVTRIDGNLTWEETPADAPEVALIEVDEFSAGGAVEVSVVFLKALVDSSVGAYAFGGVKNFWGFFKEAWTTAANSDFSVQFGKTSKNGMISGSLIVGAITVAVVVAGVIYGIGLLIHDDNAVKVGSQISNAVSIAGDLIELTILVLKIIKFAKDVAALASAVGSGVVVTVVVSVILIVAIWVMYFAEYGSNLSSVEARVAAKYAAGATVVVSILAIVTIVAFILIALGPVGLAIGIAILILLALFSIYEAIASYTDALPSVSGMLINAIAESLYEVNQYINIADSDRLDFDFGGELQNDQGFTSSNGFTFVVTVTNTIQGDRAESRVRQSAFDYILWPEEEVDEDNPITKVNHGSDYDSWTRLDNEPDVTLQLVEPDITRTIPFGDVGTGINRNLGGQLYLIEGFEIPYEFCDTMFEAIEVDCDDEYYRDTTSLDVGESQVFDILPNHLSSFLSLNWNHGAINFPRQRDRDNDGLLAVDQGGVDTDDRNPDRDNDGLTDSYEVNYGLNADEADTDFDGLTDSQELFYNTDPLKGDSDSDGLSDYVEIIQGWLIAYDGGQITRVWSNPLSADADNDALNDQQELIFGLHPQIADDPDSLDETVQFNHFDVTETNAPELLLQFEENNNATVFSDSSGKGYTAFCDQSSQDCPESRADGRYGYGLDFDGSDDHVTVDGIALANRSFTIAAWTDGSFNNQVLFGQGAGISDYKNLSFGTTGAKVYCTFGGAENTGLVTQQGINGLTHVACTYDIDTNTRTIYVNGVVAGSDSPAQPFQGSGTLYIGKHSRLNGLNLNGTIDEAAVYYRALTSTEIGAVMDGRYNTSDSILAPGDDLTYQVIVTNTNDINDVVGVMSGSSAHMDPELPDAALLFNFDAASSGDESFANAADGVSTADGCCPSIVTSVNTAHGSAASFDDNDVLTIDSSAPLANSSFTLAAWAKRSSSSANNDYIIGQGTSSQNQGLHFGFRNDGRFTCAFYGNGLNTAASASDGEWHHWACAYDATTNSRILYQDGVIVASDTASADYQGQGQIKIGSRYDGHNFNGLLDDIVIIPAAITEGAVNSLMGSSAPFIATNNEVEFFTVDALDSTTVSGSAQVNDGAATSVQQFNTYAEAIIDTGNVDVPATDANAGSLVAYLPFEDIPGSTLIENHAGAVEYSCGSQCPFVGVSGRFGQGIYFDGINDRLPEPGIGHFVPSYSIGVWVKNASGTIMDATSGTASCSGGRQGLILMADEVYYSSPCSDASIDIDLPPDVWTHLLVTVSLEQVTTYWYEGTISVYINGTLHDTATIYPVGLGTLSSEDPRIGENKTGTTPHLQGYLDDLRIYNGVALSAAEVLDLYENQGTPVLDFHFDEEAASGTFNDDSGNQLVGSPQALGCVVLNIPELGRFSGFGDEANDRVRVILDGEVIHQANYWYIGQGTAVYSSGAATWKKIYYSTVLCNSATLELEFWDEATQSAAILHTTTLDPAATEFDGSQFIVGNCDSNICVKVSGKRFTEASPTAGTNGRIGNTALFATDGALQVPDPAGHLSNLQSFTMMVWLYPEDDGGYIIAGHKRDVNNQDGFVWRVTGDGRLEIKGNWPATINVGPTPDKWQQVVLVQDVAASKMRWYIDGILVKETNVLSFDDYSESDGDPLLIGGGDGSEYFRGQMDELVIYEYALSEGMVQSIYNRQARTFASSDNVNLVIDSDHPTTVELLSDYNYRPGGYNQLVVATSDPTTEVKVLDAQINDLTALSTDWYGAVPCQENSYDVEVWCPAFNLNNEGAYQFRFRAVDAVGNETTSGLYDIYVDTTPPVISGSYNNSWIAASQEGNLKWSLSLSGSVSDPVLAGGHPGSGVYTGTITVNLVDETGVVVTDTIQPAVLNGSTWSIDYSIDGTRPQGRYTVWVTAEDLVGNVAETAVGTIILDERSPRALLTPLSLPDNISSTVTVGGIASEQVYWGSEAVKLSFEEAAGSTTFMDYSGNGNDATCTNCPGTTTGLFGQALAFDGVNDSLLFPKIVNPAAETFTAAAWVKADAIGNTRLIFAQQNGSGTGRSWLYLVGDKLGTFFGGSGQSGTTPIAAGEWHHTAVTYDGAELTLYLDGRVELTSTVTIEPADGPMVIGSNKNLTSQLFQGSIDEVVFYPQALGAEQIYALAQTLAYGVNQVEAAVQPAAPYWGGNILQLHFDETDGATTFADSSGNNLDATCSSCPAVTADGYVDSALDFDDSSDILTISNAPALSIGPELTMGTWVRPDTITAGVHRFMTLTSERAVLRINSAGRLHFYMKIDGILKGITADVMEVGEWQHVAGTYDGQTMRLYHNGLEVASMSVAGSVPSGNTLNINSTGEPFDGQMDEMVIFDRALSAAEIKGLAQTPDWQPTTLEQSGALLSDWTYTLDGDREGFYELWLRGSDGSGNTETGGVAWRGVIDTVAPRIQVTVNYTGDGETAVTEYTFTINDFAIDVNSLSYDRCDSADLVTLAYEEPERLLDGVPYQITASCTIPGQDTGTITVTACDGVGLCNTASTSTVPAGQSFTEEGSASDAPDKSGEQDHSRLTGATFGSSGSSGPGVLLLAPVLVGLLIFIGAAINRRHK